MPKKRRITKKRGTTKHRKRFDIKRHLRQSGQAAMEFLLNYGWAVLVVFIIIGALSYFGVLSPASLLPEKCTMPTSLSCVDHTVGDDGVEVKLQNGAGRSMIIREVQFSSDALSGSCTTGPIIGLLGNGESKSFAALDPASCSAVKDKGKNKYSVRVTYSWSDSPTITHTMDGELLGKVEKEAAVGSGNGDGGYVGYGSDLVGYWKFDEGIGTQAQDSASNNDGTFTGESFNDGTLMPACPNCPFQTTGKYGNSLDFDGINDYVQFNNNGIRDSGDFTWTAWINLANLPAAGANYAIILDWNGGGGKTFHIGRDGAGALGFWAEVRTTVPSTLAISTGDKTYNFQANQWYHVAFQYDGTNLKTFVDGQLHVSKLIGSFTLQTNAGNAQIGSAWGNSRYFDGFIDEVRIYNSALTEDEIQQDKDSAYPIKRAVAAFSFNSATTPGKDSHIWVKGKENSALSFDGANDYVGSTNAPFNLNTVTVAAWVKLPIQQITSQPRVVSKETGGGYSAGWRLDIGVSGKRAVAYFDVTNGTASVPTTGNDGSYSINDSVWHHLVGVVNSSHVAVYVDGALNEINTHSLKGNYFGSNPLVIGDVSNLGNAWFRGTIDEVMIYNRVLSETEISALYQS